MGAPFITIHVLIHSETIKERRPQQHNKTENRHTASNLPSSSLFCLVVFLPCKKIQLVPSLVEIFCRAFLSEQAGSAHAGRYGETECKSSGDCPLEECQELHPPLDGSGRRPECVRGRCGCPGGFYHIALGVGLER